MQALIKRSFLSVLILSEFTSFCLSQSVSINTDGTSPNASSGLEISIPDKGFLIPRLALTGTLNSTPLSTHTAGLIIFNTATTGDVSPGLYYNNGAKWIRISSAGTTTGNMLYWTGTEWALIPPGQPGQKLQLNSSSIPVWQ